MPRKLVKPGTPATQLSRADAIRRELKPLAREVDKLRLRLGLLLNEAQNRPPQGSADRTISEAQFNQLRSLETAMRDLMLASLFDSRSSPADREGHNDCG